MYYVPKVKNTILIAFAHSESSSSGSESGSSSSSTSTDSDQETKMAKKNRKKASSSGGLFIKATGLASRPGKFVTLQATIMFASSGLGQLLLIRTSLSWNWELHQVLNCDFMEYLVVCIMCILL